MRVPTQHHRTPHPSRVQDLFHSVQLNVNNPHFLIMQGRITKVWLGAGERGAWEGLRFGVLFYHYILTLTLCAIYKPPALPRLGDYPY